MQRIARILAIATLTTLTVACGDIEEFPDETAGLETSEQSLELCTKRWWTTTAGFEGSQDDSGDWTYGSRASRVSNSACAYGKCVKLEKQARLSLLNHTVRDGQRAEELLVQFKWRPKDAENNDGFVVEYRQSGTSSWTEAITIRRSSFSTRWNTKTTNLSLDIDGLDLGEPIDIRFRGISNSTNDKFFIDEIYMGFYRTDPC